MNHTRCKFQGDLLCFSFVFIQCPMFILNVVNMSNNEVNLKKQFLLAKSTSFKLFLTVFSTLSPNRSQLMTVIFTYVQCSAPLTICHVSLDFGVVTPSYDSSQADIM